MWIILSWRVTGERSFGCWALEVGSISFDFLFVVLILIFGIPGIGFKGPLGHFVDQATLLREL